MALGKSTASQGCLIDVFGFKIHTANMFQVRMALLNINTVVLSINFFAIITP